MPSQLLIIAMQYLQNSRHYQIVKVHVVSCRENKLNEWSWIKCITVNVIQTKLTETLRKKFEIPNILSIFGIYLRRFHWWEANFYINVHVRTHTTLRERFYYKNFYVRLGLEETVRLIKMWIKLKNLPDTLAKRAAAEHIVDISRSVFSVQSTV